MNKSINTIFGVAIIIIVATAAGVFIWKTGKNNLSESKIAPPSITAPKACTMEAKLCPDGETYVARSGPNCEFAPCPETAGIADKLVVASPLSGAAVSSPVSVSGRAVGGWFFEGSFPISIEDEKGRVLGKGIANFVPSYEGEEWMTENFVNFRAELTFSKPSVSNGYIIFSRDNPSGNPALDETFRLPVKFDKAIDISTWKLYQNEKYGLEFKYPKDWKVEKKNGTDMPHDAWLNITPIITNQSNENLEFSMAIIKSTEKPEVWFQQIVGPEVVKSTFEINGSPAIYDAYNSKSHLSNHCVIANGKTLAYMVFSEILRQGTSLEYSYSQYLPIFKQILSTFKFTK